MLWEGIANGLSLESPVHFLMIINLGKKFKFQLLSTSKQVKHVYVSSQISYSL